MAVNYRGSMEDVEIQKLENRFNIILDRIIQYYPDADLLAIRKAFDYALEKHAGQVRKSGEPYLSHPLEVLDILAELKQDEVTLIAGILHDTVEDTDATLEEIAELFNEDVAFLVDGVTKVSKVKMKDQSRQAAQAENIRKMILAMCDDYRVILVKLADRLHNMRTLKHMPKEKQQRIASETMEIYARIAHRLGIGWIKTELEDLSFMYLYPDEYYQIAHYVSRRKRERESYVREAMNVLRDVLMEENIDCTVSGRPKSFWSIYQKMQQKNIGYEQIYDILAFRVIVKEHESECYEALGKIHHLWRPIEGRFKDYISLPKPNGYQSLHTSVFGPKGERIEVQVRTEKMHRVAEEGIAAHWLYKEKRTSPAKDDKIVAWAHRIKEESAGYESPADFLDNVKYELDSTNVIYVYTPNSDLKELPKGATVLDFAYSIHTEVGDHCTGGIVGKRLVSIRHVLQMADTCEVKTSKSQKPKKEWLEFAQTTRARSKIKRFVWDQERARSQEIGREILDRELRKKGSAYASVQKNGELQRYVESSKYHSEFELLVEIGYGKACLPTIISKILDLEIEPEESTPTTVDDISVVPERIQRPSIATFKAFLKQLKKDKNVGIKIEGVDNPKVEYANCCRPVPGDEVVGFTTVGRGLSIHVRGCERIANLDPKRLLDASWKGSDSNKKHKVRITVQSVAQSGMLATITSILAEAKVDITENYSYINSDARTATHILEVKVINANHLKDVVARLKRKKGILKITRDSLGDLAI